MRFNPNLTVAFLLLAVSTVPSDAEDGNEPRRLPEGNSGVASQYAQDTDIEHHQDVVFVENFDDNLEAVKVRWESVQDAEGLSLSSDVPFEREGNSSLLVTHVGGRGNGSYLYRRFPTGYVKLHYRFYVKFDEACAPIHHFFHVGGYNPSTSWPQGGAGQRPRGNERFTTGVEPFGNDWRWDFYAYWRDMRGSPPRGQCWGNSFIHNPQARVTKGSWQCIELMMKLNDVDRSNGELALWLDGKLISHLGAGFPQGKWVYDKFLPGRGGEGVRWSDQLRKPVALHFPAAGEPFEGFRWRTDEQLNLNFLWLLSYITASPPGHESKIWFDGIVVAKEYIGPTQPPN